MKRLFSVLLFAAALLGIGYAAFLPQKNAAAVGAEAASVSVAAGKSEPAMKVDCKAAYLVDAGTGTVMFERNSDAHYPIASMTKIMTLLLTFEHVDSGALNLDGKITISDEAAHMGGSQAFLDAGSEYEAGELIKTVVIASANDSSVALAETVAGSQELFVQKMNVRAKELGMENTVFVNCTGLPEPGQYSSAKDVSLMTRELLKHKQYYQYTGIWMEDFKHPSGRVTGLTNTNKLTRFYKGCDSGKTGYTAEAGHCLSASAKRGNLRLVSTLIGAPDSKSRFRDVSGMFNYGFANYDTTEVVSKEQPLEQKLKVGCGKEREITVRPAESFYELHKKTDKPQEMTFEYDVPGAVPAPITAGDAVGKLMVIKSGVVVKEIALISDDSVEKAGFIDILQRVIEKFKF